MKTEEGEILPTGKRAGGNCHYALSLCDLAAKKLKAAGFHCAYTSMRSEACYYRLGNRTGLLRVAAHRLGRTESRRFETPIWACLTIPETYSPKSDCGFDAQIYLAVGRYVMIAGLENVTFVQ
jgi:hypothetical protein